MIDVEALYREHADRVLSYFIQRVPNRDRQLAEDLTSKTFLSVLKAAPRYEDRGRPLTSWLYRIANNVLIDHVRVKTTDAIEVVDQQRAVIDAGSDRQVSTIDVRAAVTGLASDQRAILNALYIQGQRDCLAAEALGMTADSLGGRKRRALTRLRTQLGVTS